MTLLRRFLVIAALLYWQGGFLFYVTVVIPVGREVLGSFRQQALVTRQATWVLNLAGVATLLLLGWDLWRARDPSRGRRWGRRLLWLGLLLSLLGLAGLHPLLERQFDPTSRTVHDPHTFSAEHHFYVWISLAQGILALAILALTLRSWRGEDVGCGKE